MKERIPIYFVDLTHTRHVISSEVFPFAAGLIGAKLQETFADEVEVELFKFPHDLTAALDRKQPPVVGFTNYSWNMNLSYGFAKKIKEKHPGTVIVFGGPNYGVMPEETADFWKRYPLIDFYIVKDAAGKMSIVDKMPADAKSVVKGPFKTKDDADKAMKGEGAAKKPTPPDQGC